MPTYNGRFGASDGIHPLVTDSEIFYYWHTHMKPEDKEEPNPTLYIIKLKK